MREEASALARVPSDGRAPGTARLRFFYGPMDCGKSTLALQTDHNHSRQGRRGMRITLHDRSGEARITSRIGLGVDAVSIEPGTDLFALVVSAVRAHGALDYLVCDEVQFYAPGQIDQLGQLVDTLDLDVYAFGLATDFRSELFPGAQRLFELADEHIAIQVEVLCWCGRPGRQNSRVIDGRVVREGDQVVVADVTGSAADDASVSYQVLCRRHWVNGDLGPGQGQAQLDLQL